MKAIVYRGYGSADVLRLEDIDKPVPADDQVLVKVRATSVNPFDLHMMLGTPFLVRLMFGLLRPKIARLGMDVAGEVDAVGRKVTRFKPGDPVFGGARGSFAEYVCASESALALKPAALSFEQAGAVRVAGITALQGLRKGRICSGQKVLIDGASGGVGSFAIQIAKAFGAEVTAVCSTGNLDTARALGADHVIDYTREDFSRKGQHYDVIVAPNAYHSIFDYHRALAPKGIYVMIGGGGAQMLQAISLGPFLFMFGSKKLRLLTVKRDARDMESLKELVEAGKLKTVIDRRYSLSEVPEAMRYLEQGHARGKVVISL